MIRQDSIFDNLAGAKLIIKYGFEIGAGSTIYVQSFEIFN